jgi:hypothetical protein
MGRKNANLRSEMTRLLRRAGVSILAKIVPFDPGEQADGVPTRIPTARGLLLAWQLTKDCSAELFAGHRG